MTKDNVNVRIDSVLYWHIENPFRAKFNVSNVRRALVERWDSSYYIMFTFVLTIIRYICRTQTTLRHILGAKVLQDCIENREAIAKEIQDVTRPVAKQWGVRVSFFFLDDLTPHPQTKACESYDYCRLSRYLSRTSTFLKSCKKACQPRRRQNVWVTPKSSAHAPKSTRPSWCAKLLISWARLPPCKSGTWRQWINWLRHQTLELSSCHRMLRTSMVTSRACSSRLPRLLVIKHWPSEVFYFMCFLSLLYTI